MDKLVDNDKVGTAKVQLDLSDVLCQANAQDKTLMTWIELVCDHNIDPSKTRDELFMKHLAGKKRVGYEMLISLLLRLPVVVEERIAK